MRQEVRKYAEFCIKVAFDYTHNKSDTEELVQATFARAVEFIGNYTPGTAMTAWLIKILCRLFLSQYKYRQVRKDFATAVSSDRMQSEYLGSVPSPLDVEAGVFSDEVVAALKGVNSSFLEAFLLREMSELGQSEIAKMLRIAPGTVASRVSRGRDALAKVLQTFAQTEYRIGCNGVVKGAARGVSVARKNRAAEKSAMDDAPGSESAE